MKKWYEKPLRIAALQWESKGDSKQVLKVWKEMGFNVEQLFHISAEDAWGYFREEKKKVICDYIAEAKRKGLRIIFYLAPSLPRTIAVKEEWYLHDKERNRIDALCVNSPYRELFFIHQIKKVANLDIDGVFLDGPTMPQGTCYCPSCTELFRREYENELPTIPDPKNKVWRDFIDFRYESVANFLRDTGKALKSVKPDAIIYMNSQMLGAGAPFGRDNRRLIQYQDMLGAEGGFIFYREPDTVPWWKPGVTARLIESQAGGKPTVIFIAGDHKSWNRYLHTAAETRLLIADSVANGASSWYGIHSSTQDLNSSGGRAAADMVRFLKKNETYYESTESLAETGLLWSCRTADYYGMEVEATDFTSEQKAAGRVSYADCFAGFCEILLRLHIPFDVIDEMTLLETRLNKYKTLILPNAAFLANKEIEAIRNFVSSGGNLVSSWETSSFGGDYARGDNFLLADVLGARLGKKVYEFRNSSYMSPEGKHQILQGGLPELLPAPNWGLEIAPTTGQALAHFREPVWGQYKPLPKITTPAIVLNKYGKGHSMYFAGNFGEFFKNYGISDLLRIMGNSLNWLSEPLITTENLPETVEVVLRLQRKKKRLLIHLVNFTGAMRRPISGVTRINKAVVEIPERTLGAAGLEGRLKVKFLKSRKKPLVARLKKTLCIIVPELEEYELLVITE